MGEGSFSIWRWSPFGGPNRRAWLNLGLVLALVATQLVFVVEPARAAVAGTATETATLENTVDFVDKDIDEIQDVSNDATGGTFMLRFPGETPTKSLKYNADPTSASDVNELQTLYNGATAGTFTITFDGQTTAAIDYNASAAAVDTALEALSNIGTDGVTVAGTGILADPWTITFEFPQDVPEITTDDLGLTGVGSTIATTTQGNLSVETALEALPNIVDVSVTGTGTLPTPWHVTFHYPAGVKMLQAVDSLTGGSATTTISPITNGVSAPIDPSGIVYLGSDTFLVADSEIDEEPTVFDDVNLFEVDSLGTIDVNRLGVDDEKPIEPTGLGYNPSNDHIYITNDQMSGQWVQDVNPGGDGIYGTGDDSSTFLDLTDGPLNVTDAEDVTWDEHEGQIWVAGGTNGILSAIKPGPNGVFDGISAGDDVFVATHDLSAFVGDMEGIGYRSVTRTLVVTDANNPEHLYEVTKDGRLIRTIDINAFAKLPGDLDFAPPSSGGGDDHIYLVDRNVDNNSADTSTLRDGKMYELSAPFENLSPFVDAGEPQFVDFGEAANLDGDAYDDGQPTPTSMTVTWSQVSGPVGGTATFADSSKLDTTVTFDKAGLYELKLVADDGSSTSSEDTVQVSMAADPNQAPVANAGPDQEITLPSMAVLNGAANDDGLPDPPGSLTYLWEKVSGPGTVTFGDDSALSTTASFSTDGVYVLSLTVDDSAKQDTDEVAVTVNPEPPDNQPPTVSAGPDQLISLASNASLMGTASDDGLPDPPGALTYLWEKASGPGTVTFGNSAALSTIASFSTSGIYVLRLTADDSELQSMDQVTITVNQAPSVSAGPDKAITLPSGVSLAGSAGDDGLPDPPGSVTTTWSKVSGPGSVVFANTSATSTTATFSTAGTYVLRLTADDSQLQTMDQVTITVNPAPIIDYFDDDDGNIFEGDINWLAGEGITKGCGPRLYCPDDLVTRGQMAAFLVRALNLKAGAGANLFVDDDGHLFENDIDKLATAGITKGCNPPTNDEFCPDLPVTRGAMAAFLHRALG